MPLAKCLRCKKLYSRSAEAVCPACYPQEEADRQAVRDVLEKHPGLDADGVADRAEVDVDIVLRMIDEGILTSEAVAAKQVKCGKCGKPAISATKRLCEKCLDNLQRNIHQKMGRTFDESHSRVGLGSVRKTLEEKRRT